MGKSRATVLRAIFAAVIAAGSLAHLSCTRGDPQSQSPPGAVVAAEAEPPGRARGMNLLLVTLDTTRADRLGCYGHRSATTKCIDGLAAHGLRFERATAPAPLTLPSHATLMTGLDVPAHGARNNGTFRLSDSHTTLAEHLHAAGYATSAFIGAYVLDAQYGLAQGFDHYDDRVGGGQVESGVGNYVERRAERVVAASIAWLRAHAARTPRSPFFAWLHLFDAHRPHDPPEPFDLLFQFSPYDGEIAYIDAQLKTLMDALRELDTYDDTLVVLTADHGEGLGEHGEDSHGFLLHDATLRVPLIISGRRLFPQGAVESRRLIGLVDLLPSLLYLLGVPVPAGLDGRSYFGSGAEPGRTYYIETMATYLDHGWAPLHGLRRFQDKYTQGAIKEYYDLASDPKEDRNIYSADLAAAQALEGALRDRLARWPSAAQLAATERAMDPIEAERLAALGYARFPAASERGTRDPRVMLPLHAKTDRANFRSLSGAHAEAIREIQEVLAADGENAHALYIASFIYKRAGRWQEAEACLRKGVALCPRSDGYVQLAQMVLQRGDLKDEEFERLLAEAERLDPEDGGIHCARGDRFALAATGMDPHSQRAEIEKLFAAAIHEFEKALAVDPERSGATARDQLQRARAFLAKLQKQ